MKRSLLAAALVTIGGATWAETPTLTVYTYDSFVSDWGPGPAIEAAFEETCGCDLAFVGTGDGAALLARLKLEGARTKADVVLGLDTSLIANAKATELFAPHNGTSAELDLPIAWTDNVFLPYDWGYFAFVYDKTQLSNAPTSFAELLESDVSIVIQDPRSSTPGLGLLLWVKEIYGDKAAEVWETLSPRIVTVTKGWSEAYGMFLEGEADMVLSYTTSPAYHLIAEEDGTKAAAIFDEGHYMQIEVAAKVAGTKHPQLADEFLDFMLSDAFQSIIPTTNWMYPAVLPSSGLPDGFISEDGPEKALLISIDNVEPIRKEALSEWLTALSQ
ncbi:thiamine ABC transporter substrate binding subunit [Rhodobacterales bacterium 52_120_T64]|nr:thiamine ABC transporter substrate binding subunit [Rhodobacterales bacterium 52_120_T64]